MPSWQGYRKADLHPSAHIYAAIMGLRRKGHTVYRHARDDRHVVDGEIVPTSWLMERARMAGVFQRPTPGASPEGRSQA